MEFRGSPNPSIGLEYELQLIDARSLDLVEGVMPLLEFFPGSPYVKPEFIQYSIEIASKPCANAQELHAHLAGLLREVRDKAQALGMRLCGAGTHPFCRRLAPITPLPRYRKMDEYGGYLAHLQIAYAVHVHIGVRDAAQAMRVTRRLRPYLAVLLALSANSPFWRGHDTHWASYRQRIIVAAHAYGVPPEFDTWEEFQAIIAAARRAHIFDTFKDMHWDLRPRPDYGTLEVRVMDSQSSLRRVMGFAVLIRTLVEYLERAGRDDPRLPELPVWIETENLYRASHEALDAVYVFNRDGETRPIKALATQMLASLRPLAAEQGELQWLDAIDELIEQGPGCGRQRAIYRDTGSLKQVVVTLADELDADLAAAR